MTDPEKRLFFTIADNDLACGVNFIDEARIIVHKDEHGNLQATRNRCKHQGHHFVKTKACVLTCLGHGWKLDPSTMTYVSPLGGLKQEKLLVEKEQNGEVRLYEILNAPWESEQQLRQSLRPLDLTIRFYAHACAEVRCGSTALFTDPWLVGPAFTRGWWLAHQPPADWLDRLAAAEAIYISHNHSDHLSVHTLKLLAARNPHVPLFVPAFDNDYCLPILKRIGLTNVNVAPFNQWVVFGGVARFMILRDGTGRNDSGILIEYKGHRILNTVDCQNLNNGALPPVDVLLTSFAGGASGYPVCWEDYPDSRRSEIIQKKRQAILLSILDVVTKTRPRIYIPFAGYFTEAHPADHGIRTLNTKNSPQHVAELLHKHCPETVTWIPQPGRILDVGLGQQVNCVPAARRGDADEAAYDFEPYLREISESRKFVPLQTAEGLKRYFEWAGFRGNMVLHVIETSEDFQNAIREFYVDFNDLSFPSGPPQREHLYLRMRCRSDVFRHVLREGLPWEEISIGFQARFVRNSDVYEFDFWDHFQNKLPKTLPGW